MLKARPTLFAPALPAAKRSAIGRLGFGVLDVVYLEYPERFGPRTAFRSYSNLPTGSSHADRAQLAQPVAGKLIFAGEATHERDPATLHGAYLSGIR